jgi:phage-related protein
LENIKPAAAEVRQDAGEVSQFSWETPAGWKQIEDTTGMRLAAFSIESGERQALCTIISLAGTAGGIKANVLRWASQIDVIMEPDSKKLEEFLAKKEDFRTRNN